ncbi:MAG: choice-of-anchor N protein [bacterium]
MKNSKIFLEFYTVLYIILIVSTSSYAIPTLRLYCPDIHHDHYEENTSCAPFDEDILISDPSFTLQALFYLPKKNAPDVVKQDFYLTCALVGLNGTKVSNSPCPFSVSVNNSNYSSDSFSFGQPIGIHSHGVFNTYYTQILFNFDETDFTPDGIFDNQDPLANTEAGYIHTFDISLNGLNKKYGVLFDLSPCDIYKGEKDIAFAALSRDRSLLFDQDTIVPLPSSLLLLFVGFVSIAAFKGKLNGKTINRNLH